MWERRWIAKTRVVEIVCRDSVDVEINVQEGVGFRTGCRPEILVFILIVVVFRTGCGYRRDNQNKQCSDSFHVRKNLN